MQQGDVALDTEATTAFMRDFVRDPRRNVEPAYFTPKEVTVVKPCFKFSHY